VLSAINAQMQSSMRRDMFITIIYAIIDQAKQEITFARAGHELPFFYHRASDGTCNVETIQSQGMALGMVPPEIFDLMIKDKTVPFSKDDALILYTDGVTESVNSSGEEYSGARLMNALKTHGNGSAQSILNQLMNSVQRFSGDEGQPDDLTLITIKHS